MAPRAGLEPATLRLTVVVRKIDRRRPAAMKMRRRSDLRARRDRGSISVNVDTTASFERATSQFTSQLNHEGLGLRCPADANGRRDRFTICSTRTEAACHGTWTSILVRSRAFAIATESGVGLSSTGDASTRWPKALVRTISSGRSSCLHSLARTRHRDHDVGLVWDRSSPERRSIARRLRQARALY